MEEQDGAHSWDGTIDDMTEQLQSRFNWWGAEGTGSMCAGDGKRWEQTEDTWTETF